MKPALQLFFPHGTAKEKTWMPDVLNGCGMEIKSLCAHPTYQPCMAFAKYPE
jgi:hypothetical protein